MYQVWSQSIDVWHHNVKTDIYALFTSGTAW